MQEIWCLNVTICQPSKFKGQIYHLTGSLLPENNEELKLYCTGDDINQTTVRCKNYPRLDIDIAQDLQKMLNLENSCVDSFKHYSQKNEIPTLIIWALLFALTKYQLKTIRDDTMHQYIMKLQC